ncbi:MAG: DNA polymerase III subunit delta' [Bdellovibrionales bacterium]
MLDIPSSLESASVIGHKIAKETISKTYESGRMHHAWLITGADGIGKTTLAVHMAHMLLSNGANGFSSFSLAHPVARLIMASAHPDFFHIAPPLDEATGLAKQEIPVAEARKIAPFMRMTPSHGAGRVALIEEAHKLNRNAQNAILKIIEEPSKGATVIMTATTSAALLPTIRSRCHHLKLNALAREELETVLMRMGVELPEDSAAKAWILDFSNGSVGYALKLLACEGRAIYDELLVLLKDLPEMNVERLHEVAGMLSKKSDQQNFEVAGDLLNLLLQQAVQAAARGKVDQAGLAVKLGGRAALDKMLFLCEKVEEILRSAQFSNLDKKLVFIDAMLEIKRAS